MSKHTIAVYGWDDFGFALAHTLSKLDNETHAVKYHTKNEEIMGRLVEHGTYKKGVVQARLENVDIVSDEADLFDSARTIYLDAPVDEMRGIANQIKEGLAEGVTIVGVNPGIENSTGLRVSEVVAEELEGVSYHYVQLGGDQDAFSVLRGDPLRMGIASLNRDNSINIEEQLQHGSIMPFISEDIVTAEVSQALGGVLALYSGILSGIGYSTKTATGLTCDFAESLKQLAADIFGAHPDNMTVQNPFWANSQWIMRNTHDASHQLGLAVSEGLNIDQAIAMFTQNKRYITSVGTLQGLDAYGQAHEHPVIKVLLQIFVERTADPQALAVTIGE